MKWFKRVDEKPELVYCKQCHLKALYDEAIQKQRCPRCNYIGKSELPKSLQQQMDANKVIEKVCKKLVT